MWAWSIIFLVLAILGGIFGLASIASPAAALGKAAFFVFLTLFALSVLWDYQERRHGHL